MLLFDNVEKASNLHLLIPYGSSSALIILSRQKDLYLPTDVTYISLESFTDEEVLALFAQVLNKRYVKEHKKILLDLGKIVGNLPLAVHVLASQLKESEMSPASLLKQGEKEAGYLRSLAYENKNLLLALEVSYANLSQKTRAVFLSLGVFEGKDFSVGAIGYMNGMTKEKTRSILDELYNVSLIETSLDDKFRIHPIVKIFIAEKLNNPYLSLLNKISIIVFVIFTISWIILQTLTTSDNFARHIFSSLYFLVALWGAIWGIKVANKWGGRKSVIGKAVLFFSIGLFLQVFGQISYAYYSLFRDIAIPYPSLGDAGYALTIPIYTIAVFFLAKTSGIKVGLQTLKNHLASLILFAGSLILCLMLLLQYYVFVWTNPSKIFLDFIYPIGDWIYLYLAFLIYLELKRAKKNIMKNKILFFVIALFIQALSDFVFIYQANLKTWENGNINDFMYLTSYLLMTLAILQLNSYMTRMIKK